MELHEGSKASKAIVAKQRMIFLVKIVCKVVDIFLLMQSYSLSSYPQKNKDEKAIPQHPGSLILVVSRSLRTWLEESLPPAPP